MTTKHLKTTLFLNGLSVLTGLATNSRYVLVVAGFNPITDGADLTNTLRYQVNGGKVIGYTTNGTDSCTVSSVSYSGTSPVQSASLTITPQGSFTVATGNTVTAGTDLGLVLSSGTPGAVSPTMYLSTELSPDTALSVGNVVTVGAFNVTMTQPV